MPGATVWQAVSAPSRELQPMTAMQYEIRVSGAVPPAVLDEFEGVRAVVHPTVTVLTGPVPDRAALHGILNRLLGLDLEVIDLHRLTGDPDPQERPGDGPPATR